MATLYRPRALLIAVLAIVGLIAGACSGGGNKSGNTPISLRSDVFFYGSHVLFMTGIEEGIYKKHGLDVTFKTGTGSAAVGAQVANGSDNFGFVDAGVLTQLAGKGVHATTVLGVLEGNPMAIMSRPQTGIKTPKDLNGKVAGITATSSPELLFPAFAKKTGVDVNSITKRQVDIATRDSLFVQGKTQFTFGLTVVQLSVLEERCKCTLNTLKYADYGINSMANGLVVNNDFAKNHPDKVRDFVAATVEAINFAVKNPDKAVDDFFKFAKDNTQLSRKVVAEQWQATIPLLHTKATANEGYGCMSNTDWQQTIDLLTQYGGVEKGKVKPADVYTNSYLPSGSCG